MGGFLPAFLKEIKSSLFGLAFCLCLGWSVVLSGSSQTIRNQKAIQHEVVVTLKLVQVYVTDKSGKPVVDLEKSDFIIYDNGLLQKSPILKSISFLNRPSAP